MKHEELLAAALAKRDKGDVQGAIAILESIVVSHPDTDSAESARAHLYNLRMRGTDSADALESALEPSVLMEQAARIKVATAPFIAGYEVCESLGIVTGECAYGMHALFDFAAGWRDLAGGRSGSIESFLHNASFQCTRGLQTRAAAIGADAVISVDLSYSEISGGGKSMLFAVASGTAVRLQQR